jgi:cytochrome c oxidase cbb3-type subunit IV
MDLNEIRSAVTVLSFIVFALIVARAWHKGRRGGFDEVARLPLAADEPELRDATIGIADERL